MRSCLISSVKGIDRVSPIKSKYTGNSDSPRSSANVNFSGIAPVVSNKLTDLEKDKVNVGKDKALKHKLTDLEKDKVNVGKDKAPKHKALVKNSTAVVYKARKQKTPVKKLAVVVEKPDAVVDKALKHKAPAKKPTSVVVNDPAELDQEKDKEKHKEPAKEPNSVVGRVCDVAKQIMFHVEDALKNEAIEKASDVVNDSVVVESVCDVVKASDALKNKVAVVKEKSNGKGKKSTVDKDNDKLLSNLDQKSVKYASLYRYYFMEYLEIEKQFYLSAYSLVPESSDFSLKCYASAPPTSNAVKLNCDGAFKSNQGAVGIVDRDSEGVILAVIGERCHASSALAMELLAIRNTCNLALTNGWVSAVIESDSTYAIAFSSSECVPPWALGVIVADIRDWASQLNLQFSWVRRTCNRVAHHVEGYTHRKVYEWLDFMVLKLSILQRILKALMEENEGRFYSSVFFRCPNSQSKGIRVAEANGNDSHKCIYITSKIKRDRPKLKLLHTRSFQRVGRAVKRRVIMHSLHTNVLESTTVGQVPGIGSQLKLIVPTQLTCCETFDFGIEKCRKSSLHVLSAAHNHLLPNTVLQHPCPTVPVAVCTANKVLELVDIVKG
ncbi:F-box domain containing protein [Tanacetum coccineum]